MNLNIMAKAGESDSATDIIHLLLKKRDIKDIEAFLNPPHPFDISLSNIVDKKDWRRFKKELTKATNLIVKLHKDKRSIVVFTDYDADGITGGAIMWEALHLSGCNVMPHVPDRRVEGYGFSQKGIDIVKEKYNPECIISVDHGVVAHEIIEYASSLGIKVIVTDHHQKKKTLPPHAFAVLHTTYLSGSGLAYFIATHFVKSIGGEKKIASQLKNDYCSLAAIGTIADLVPLVGVNRGLVKHGLRSLNKTKRAGLKQLLKEARILDKPLTPYEVGYIIAPRINAFGRLAKGIDALRLLCTTSEKRAHDLAKKAGDTNRKRQQLVAAAVEQADKQVDKDDLIIVVASESWNEGIIGLIASRLADKYYKPTIAMTRSDGQYKGSVRSIKKFDIISYLRKFESLFIDLGGHDQAAGFKIKKDNIEKLKKDVNKNAKKALTKIEGEREISVDVELPLSKATLTLAGRLEKLQPFGIGNPKPTFVSNASIKSATTLGKDGSHLSLVLEDSDGELQAIQFNKGETIRQIARGQKARCVYTLNIDAWGGREKVKAFVKHLYTKV